MSHTVRETKRAAELQPGDHIAARQQYLYADLPIKVLGAYPDSHPEQDVLLVYSGLDGKPTSGIVRAGIRFELATDAELTEARQAADRAAFAAGLREFAAWVEANPWAPVQRPSGYPQQALLQIDLNGADPAAQLANIDRVRDIADRLGVEVITDLDDRTQVDATIGAVAYSVIAWHRGGRPAMSRTRAMLAHWAAGLAPETESGGVADPTGLHYTRADDEPDDPTPVSPGRVPLHTGAVTDEGLVDETEPCTVEHTPDSVEAGR